MTTFSLQVNTLSRPPTHGLGPSSPRKPLGSAYYEKMPCEHQCLPDRFPRSCTHVPLTSPISPAEPHPDLSARLPFVRGDIPVQPHLSPLLRPHRVDRSPRHRHRAALSGGRPCP